MSESGKPWVSFCMSTYKRPGILRDQLILLSQQIFSNFEIVVSDNDPEGSARKVVEDFRDMRFRYFHNEENLGMIRSFNKSIERATAEYIVMVTDDDPVDPSFLLNFYNLYEKYPSYSIYCGFSRKNRAKEDVEFITGENFVSEVLDPDQTSNLLWSSSIVRKKDALKIGLIPDYNSPHLADHAFMAMVGSIDGGLILNKMYSTLSSHDSNFSKINFHYYVNGCSGFYNTMITFCKKQPGIEKSASVIKKHLGRWFISNFFNAKKYYTVVKDDTTMVKSISDCAKKILEFPFMKKYRIKYYLKSFIFSIKRRTGLLRIF